MDLQNAKIAVATDDGTTVSSHFGRAGYYEVIHLAAGRVVRRERREKAGHHSFGPEGSSQGEHDHEHRHRTMVSPILDCQAVIVRGMGQGAVDHLRRANLLPVLTGLRTIDEVIAAIASGTLDHDPRRVHQHHGDH
ncbi:MAG TPA: NifB/NifX family molybdenum-iron cluster-binding protein [Bacteroidota bacterium]|nr:NifB/NifX family molybdenum-iron cluster-binding protein [Bacteroidota bacterium]